MREEEENNCVPSVNKIDQGFQQFCMYYNLMDNMKEERALAREELKKEKAVSKRESQIDTKVEFGKIEKALDKQHKERMKVEIDRQNKESSNKEQRGAWGGSRSQEDQHIYEKPLNDSFEYEEEDFQERPYRLGRGFNSGLECFPSGKQVVNRREENEFDDFDEFRERNKFNSLSLGHRKYQEKHQETVAVDSIKEAITNATDRMTQNVEDFHRASELFPSSQRDTEISDSTSLEEDEGEEVQDHRGSMHTFTPKRRQWSPAKNRLINLVAKDKTEGKDDSKKDDKDKRKMKYEERLVLKSKFIDQMRGLEESQAALNSELEQLQLDEDPEGDNDILELTSHLTKIGPELLEGSYATRVELMRTLTNRSGAIIQKKSRRLQGLGPEIRDLLKIKNPRERRHLMIEEDIEEGNFSPKPREDGNKDEYGDK